MIRRGEGEPPAVSSLGAVLVSGIDAGTIPGMSSRKKVTVHVDKDLLRRGQERTGQGVTATIRQGLELVAASDVYERLRTFRGKVRFSIDLNALREDRG